MSAPERALSDSRNVDAAMLGLIHNPDDLAAAANRPFFRRFVASLPPPSWSRNRHSSSGSSGVGEFSGGDGACSLRASGGFFDERNSRAQCGEYLCGPDCSPQRIISVCVFLNTTAVKRVLTSRHGSRGPALNKAGNT